MNMPITSVSNPATHELPLAHDSVRNASAPTVVAGESYPPEMGGQPAALQRFARGAQPDDGTLIAVMYEDGSCEMVRLPRGSAQAAGSPPAQAQSAGTAAARSFVF